MKKAEWVTEEFKVKGMICTRCLKVLNTEFQASGAEVTEIELGRVVVRYNPEKTDRSTLAAVIHENEFEIIADKESVLAEQTKRWVINYVWSTDLREKLSDYLAAKLNRNYQRLSRNFSTVFGQTIERFAVLIKVERTKEMLEHNQLSSSEIAFLLGYQNVSALSRQFKRETNMTLSEYRSSGAQGRTPIDRI